MINFNQTQRKSIFKRLLSEQEQKGPLSSSHIVNETPFYSFTSQRTNADLPESSAPRPLRGAGGNLQTLEGSSPHFLAFSIENMGHNITISCWLRDLIKSTEIFIGSNTIGKASLELKTGVGN